MGDLPVAGCSQASISPRPSEAEPPQVAGCGGRCPPARSSPGGSSGDRRIGGAVRIHHPAAEGRARRAVAPPGAGCAHPGSSRWPSTSASSGDAFGASAASRAGWRLQERPPPPRAAWPARPGRPRQPPPIATRRFRRGDLPAPAPRAPPAASRAMDNARRAGRPEVGGQGDLRRARIPSPAGHHGDGAH